MTLNCAGAFLLHSEPLALHCSIALRVHLRICDALSAVVCLTMGGWSPVLSFFFTVIERCVFLVVIPKYRWNLGEWDYWVHLSTVSHGTAYSKDSEWPVGGYGLPCDRSHLTSFLATRRRRRNFQLNCFRLVQSTGKVWATANPFTAASVSFVKDSRFEGWTPLKSWSTCLLRMFLADSEVQVVQLYLPGWSLYFQARRDRCQLQVSHEATWCTFVILWVAKKDQQFNQY